MKELTSFSGRRSSGLIAAVLAVVLGLPGLAGAVPEDIRATIPVGTTGSAARGSVFDASGRFVFVIDSAASQLSIIDRWRLEVRSTFNLLAACVPVDLIRAGSRLYVSCSGLDRVEALDISGVTGDAPEITRLVSIGVPAGDNPGPLAYHAGIDRVLAGNRGTAKSVSVIDNSVATPVKVGSDITVCNGSDPHGIGVAANGKVYVSCGDGTIDVLSGFPATPGVLTSLSGVPLSGFIPYEITGIGGTYLYVAYTNGGNTNAGYIVINTTDDTLCTNNQHVGAGALSMLAFTDTDSTPDHHLAFLIETGAVYTVVYTNVNAVEAGACPVPGPPAVNNVLLDIPSETPMFTGRRRMAFDESLLVLPSNGGRVFAVSSAPQFLPGFAELAFATHNNTIGTDPLFDPDGVDGDRPLSPVSLPFTTAAGSSLDPVSLEVTLYPSGNVLTLNAVSASGGNIQISASDLELLTESQVVEARFEAASTGGDSVIQLMRILRLDLERPANMSAPVAQSTGTFVAVQWSSASDTCPSADATVCAGLRSGPGQVISGPGTYIVRIQSTSDPSVVRYAAVPAPATSTTIGITGTGFGIDETWLAAVAVRDRAGNRSASFSGQSYSSPLPIGALALFGEDGGFGCQTGRSGARLALPMAVFLVIGVMRATRRRKGMRP
ncbi:MAG: hypothetical protein KIT79_05950 [Deltaproteobacteria bacterium]|nr:hypothetical protein [Deltaproteobacteria bacterium]